MVEQYPVRGYLSSVDNRLHFGLGGMAPDSLRIVWPDGKTQLIGHPQVNCILQVSYGDAAYGRSGDSAMAKPVFIDVTMDKKMLFQHKETFFYDYAFQPLIQQKYSQEGPFISTGDVNGDGLEDLFIGGAFRQSGRIFLQQADGSFAGRDLVTGVKNEEDMQSIFFDADGDGDADLLIAGGSSEFGINSSFYRPRLYLNDGKGNFRLDDTAFSPIVRTPAKCLAVADMDGDGDLDILSAAEFPWGFTRHRPEAIFFATTMVSSPMSRPLSYPALENPGLINAAVWEDIDGDHKPDLVIAGDWMPVRIFRNNGDRMTEVTDGATSGSLPGFWRSLVLADIDRDGRPDIIAGNLGLNNPFISARPACTAHRKRF